MGFNCGIVGLPNVGKSTIFNALTNAGAQAANYPFCTIDPNVGIVPLNDPRLKQIAAIFKPEKILPTSVEFVDIAGLVKGASTGEGLGNQFLGHIKSVDAIAHVVRCFEDGDVVHVHGNVDPVRDIEVINTELILADLQSVAKSKEKTAKLVRAGQKDAAKYIEILERIEKSLNEGVSARSIGLSDEEKLAIKDLFLITLKPLMYVCNVDESHIQNLPASVDAVRAFAAKEGAPVCVICGSIESEIAQMNDSEKESFLKDYGLTEPGLDRLAKTGYDLLRLMTYFTAGPKEVRAWTIHANTHAPQAAGVIHSDFERGFIRAEIYHFDDLIKLGSEQKIKEAGLLRSEGKEYVVKDGDLVHFRFNV